VCASLSTAMPIFPLRRRRSEGSSVRHLQVASDTDGKLQSDNALLWTSAFRTRWLLSSACRETGLNLARLQELGVKRQMFWIGRSRDSSSLRKTSRMPWVRQGQGRNAPAPLLKNVETHELSRRDSKINSSDPGVDARRFNNLRRERPDTEFPPIEPLRPPESAPNVLVVLIDDCGSGAASAFGSPCQTPNMERLASNGLKFNRFHTTALCLPTRKTLLTGRNHHSVNMGGICEIARWAPGYSSILPKDKAALAMTLMLIGYSTARLGKCREVPVWETSPMGPFNQWPTGAGGFEYFYGSLGGETNQGHPAIYDGTAPVGQPRTAEEGYHFTKDMTDLGDWLGVPTEGAHARQAVLHVFAPARRTHRIMRPRNGSTNIRAGSTRDGTSCPGPSD
jgi:hypothetical protein